jgi:TonB family protein
LTRKPAVSYPETERQAFVEGRVWVQFVVQATGDVDHRAACVLLSDGPGFTQTALLALRDARYSPAVTTAGPVASLVVQEFTFRLRR